MAIQRVERRLVAILAADIVGYSRLVERDEAGTLAAIRGLREAVIDPLLAEHQGRIVKLMGDGAIVEFGSVVDAVACAVAIQQAVAERQAEAPADRRIVFRIGINLGDVVVEGDDLLGDGVNVAARLEQLCEPGGVLVSGTAYDQLQGKLGLPLEFIGEQRVKNIERPVRAYRVRLDGRASGRLDPVQRSGGGHRCRRAAVMLAVRRGRMSWWGAGPGKPPLPDSAVDRDPAVRQSLPTTSASAGWLTAWSVTSSLSCPRPACSSSAAAPASPIGTSRTTLGSGRSSGFATCWKAASTVTARGSTPRWAWSIPPPEPRFGRSAIERPLNDLFAVQEELTARIAEFSGPSRRRDSRCADEGGERQAGG